MAASEEGVAVCAVFERGAGGMKLSDDEVRLAMLCAQQAETRVVFSREFRVRAGLLAAKFEAYLAEQARMRRVRLSPEEEQSRGAVR